MIKILAIVAPNNVIGDSDAKKSHQFIEQIKPEINFYDKLPQKNAVMLGATTFIGIHQFEIIKNSDKVFVITRDGQKLKTNHPDIKFDQKIILENDMNKIFKYYYNHPTQDLYVGGGGQIYQSAMKWADEIIIIKSPKKRDGDLYFPVYQNKFALVTTTSHKKFDVQIWSQKK